MAVRERSAEPIPPTFRSPRPLDPVEFNPEYLLPELLARWGDGSILVAVSHQSKAHIKEPNKKCLGKILVPIPVGANGNATRFCWDCDQEVIVVGLGAIRIDIESLAREERLKKALESLNLVKT